MAIVKTDVPMPPELYNRTVQLLAEKYPFFGKIVSSPTAHRNIHSAFGLAALLLYLGRERKKPEEIPHAE